MLRRPGIHPKQPSIVRASPGTSRQKATMFGWHSKALAKPRVCRFDAAWGRAPLAAHSNDMSGSQVIQENRAR